MNPIVFTLPLLYNFRCVNVKIIEAVVDSFRHATQYVETCVAVKRVETFQSYLQELEKLDINMKLLTMETTEQRIERLDAEVYDLRRLLSRLNVEEQDIKETTLRYTERVEEKRKKNVDLRAVDVFWE